MKEIAGKVRKNLSWRAYWQTNQCHPMPLSEILRLHTFYTTFPYVGGVWLNFPTPILGFGSLTGLCAREFFRKSTPKCPGLATLVLQSLVGLTVVQAYTGANGANLHTFPLREHALAYSLTPY